MAHSATNRARSCRSGTAWAISASVVGSSRPPPNPLIAWPTHSTCRPVAPAWVPASAATAPPSAVSAMPVRNTRRRPCRSPKTPALSTEAAIGMMYASLTHCRSDVLPPVAWRIVVRATLTEVTGT